MLLSSTVNKSCMSMSMCPGPRCPSKNIDLGLGVPGRNGFWPKLPGPIFDSRTEQPNKCVDFKLFRVREQHFFIFVFFLVKNSLKVCIDDYATYIFIFISSMDGLAYMILPYFVALH